MTHSEHRRLERYRLHHELGLVSHGHVRDLAELGGVPAPQRASPRRRCPLAAGDRLGRLEPEVRLGVLAELLQDVSDEVVALGVARPELDGFATVRQRLIVFLQILREQHPQVHPRLGVFGIRVLRFSKVQQRGVRLAGFVVYRPHVVVQGGQGLRGEPRDIVRVSQQLIVQRQGQPRVRAMRLERALVLRHERVEVPGRFAISTILRRDTGDGDETA